MGELSQKFEEAFPIPAHWIEFDEKRNKYYCPYVADAKAQEYQAKWEVWQFQQSKIEQLEKELAQMKHINDEQNKNLETAFKTIEIQQKFDADSQGAIACLTEMNGRLEKRIKEGLEKIEQCEKEGCLFPEWLYWAKKALRGES